MKRILAVVGLSLVVVLIGATFAVIQLDDEAKARSQDEALAQAAQTMEAQFFQLRQPELAWLAGQSAVRQYLARNEQETEALGVLLKQVQGILDIEVVYLADPTGTIRASTNSAFVGVNITFRDYFRKSLAGLPAYDFATGIVTKTQGLYASAPVFEQGRLVGVVAFRTSAQALHQWQSTLPGLLILGPDGQIFSSPDPRFVTQEGWSWSGSSRILKNGIAYRLSRYPLAVVPGFIAVSLVPETLPWKMLLAVNLLLLLLTLTAYSVWRQLWIARVRRTENRDRQQRELLLSHLMEGIAVFDEEARLVWANPAFENLIQRAPGTPPPTMGELWDKAGPGPWREVLEGRRPWVVFESVLRGSQGGWIPVSAGFTSADGRFLLSVLDGTERYRSDQLLRQSQKLTVLGQLSGGIAHDLNNMLGVLMGMADLLKMSLPEHDPLQDSVDLILSTLVRAAGLSEKMLAFARQTPMNRVPLDVAALLRELRFLARTALPEGTTAEIQVPESPILIDGDENLLLSAFLNLILNAGEAMPDGGLVRVTISQTAKDRLAIVVEDEGRGMDRATLSRIFEPFFSTKLDKKGTGLGLSLVRRTVLEHRGTIEVQSTVGKGTRVLVTLPLSTSNLVRE